MQQNVEYYPKNNDNSNNMNIHKKRKRSPSTTSTMSDSQTLSNNMSDDNASDESFKAYNISHSTIKRRQRRKRMCNIDKEFDEEERMIKYKEEMINLNHPVSDNAFVVAYAESLHLDQMKLKNDEYFPVLQKMPRCALIKYCDYYKLRYSKRSKDNRLLQIVTKHFILHNREKYKNVSIEALEQDLFWHSVCNQHEKEQKNKKKNTNDDIDIVDIKTPQKNDANNQTLQDDQDTDIQIKDINDDKKEKENEEKKDEEEQKETESETKKEEEQETEHKESDHNKQSI